jgi:Tfp pilus assembly protein PilO
MSDTTPTRPSPGRKMDAAGLAVCALLTLAGYVVGFQPVYQAHRERTARQRELADSRAKVNDTGDALAQLKRELTQTQRAVADSPLRLQAVSQINQRLAGLTELAARAGLAMDQVQPGPPVHGKRFDTVPIHIIGSGTFPTCAKFIHLLHSEHHDTGVRSFSLSGHPASPDAPATFQCDLSWYAAPQAARKKN